ncbi:hypothetical protein LINPERPRIM_LOCUS29725 [Linum perenne]
MVGSFMRSLSFPNKKPPPPPPPSFSHHFRSISLPCRPHPLISHLRFQINDLRLWSTSTTKPLNSAWLCDGLSQLKDIHDYLDDILRLPQTQDSLRRHPTWIDHLLEDFLRFADAYGTFQNLVVTMKEQLFAAKMAMRKRDECKIASFVKSRKKLGKEMGKLVMSVRVNNPNRRRHECYYDGASSEAAELAHVLREIMEVTVEVSEAVFNGFSTRKKTTTTSWIRGLRKRAKRWESEEEEECCGIEEIRGVMGGKERLLWGLKRKSEEEIRDVMKKMMRLEGCISEIENGGERVFRSLISTRVSLLNCLTVR